MLHRPADFAQVPLQFHAVDAAEPVVPVQLADQPAQGDRGVGKQVRADIAHFDAVVIARGHDHDDFLVDGHQVAAAALVVDVPPHDVDAPGRADDDRVPTVAEFLLEPQQGFAIGPMAFAHQLRVIAVVGRQRRSDLRQRLGRRPGTTRATRGPCGRSKHPAAPAVRSATAAGAPGSSP